MFVAGEAEVNEPLPIEQPRRLLQQLNPPSVVLDQVVVGGEDGGDDVLRFKGGGEPEPRNYEVLSGLCEELQKTM